MWWILLFLLVLPAAGALYERHASVRDRSRFRPRGRMLPVNGRAFHVDVSGHGAPAVVLEAGLGASSVSWCRVQPLLAELATVVGYDRPGLGWSEPAEGPGTAGQYADDLRGLLSTAGVRPPCILVSHSAGAFPIQLFAARHPDEVAGLVLVDPIDAADFAPPTESRASRMRGGIKLARRCARLARVGFVRLFLTLVLRTGAARFAGLGFFLSSGRLVRGGERLASALRQLPAGVPETLRALWSRPVFFRALAAQIEGLTESARQVQAEPMPPGIPVTVISAGRGRAAGLESHRKMAARSERGRHTVAEASDHFILLDEPEVIVEAVREMLEAIRAEQDSG